MKVKKFVSIRGHRQNPNPIMCEHVGAAQNTLISIVESNNANVEFTQATKHEEKSSV